MSEGTFTKPGTKGGGQLFRKKEGRNNSLKKKKMSKEELPGIPSFSFFFLLLCRLFLKTGHPGGAQRKRRRSAAPVRSAMVRLRCKVMMSTKPAYYSRWH